MLLSPCKVSHTRNHPPASSGVHQTKCLNAWLPCHHRKDYTTTWRGHSPGLYLVSVSSTWFRTVKDKMEQLLPGTELQTILINMLCFTLTCRQCLDAEHLYCLQNAMI